MKKLLGLIVLAALCTALLVSAAAAEFTNPVAPGADPYILNDNGTYYLYATTGDKYGYRVFSSTNLVEWEAHGYCLMAKDVYWDLDNAPDHYKAWAPEVIKHGDTYYMVYSIDEQIGIATADSPLGPFTNEMCPEPLIPEARNIDGHFFLDGDVMYLYFVSCGEYSKNGYTVTGGNNIWGAEFDMETLTIKEDTIKLLLEHSGNDYFDKAWGEKVHGVVEGPSVIKHEGTYYLSFSIGGYTQALYSVHYATSNEALGDFARDYDNIVLISDDVNRADVREENGPHLYGTAHHTFTQMSDGSWVIVYHAHRSGWTYGEEYDDEGKLATVSPRVICIDKAYFENVEGGMDILRAGTLNQQKDVTVVTGKTALNIPITAKKDLNVGYPTTTSQEYIVGEPTRETHFEGTFASLATNENVIYVAHYDGSDENAGTEKAPVKTVEKAAELLKETGGHIIITQDYANNDHLNIPAADAPLYIGGTKDKDVLFGFKFISFNSPVYFDNLLLAPATANNNSIIVCNFNDVVFGEGISSLYRTANHKFAYIAPGAARYTGTEKKNAAYVDFIFDNDDVLTTEKAFTVKVYNGTFEGIFGGGGIRFASDSAIREAGTAPNATVWVDDDVVIRPAAAIKNLKAATNESGSYTLTFDTVEGAEKYMVLKNGTVIGYTENGTFVDDNARVGDDNKYVVRPCAGGCLMGNDASVSISTIGDENGDGELNIKDVIALVGKVVRGEDAATLMDILNFLATFVK